MGDPAAEPAWYATQSFQTMVEVLGIALAVLLPVLGFVWWQWRVGGRGQRELRRIYIAAIQGADPDRAFAESATRLVRNPKFFRRTLQPNWVSRADEFAAFKERILADSSCHAQQIEETLQRVFEGILEGLQDAQYPAWKQKYERWLAELEQSAAQKPASDPRIPAYLVLALLNSESAAAAVCDGARNFFTHRERPLEAFGGEPLMRTGDAVESDPQAWRELLVEAVRAVRQAERDNRRVHLVLGTMSLWTFALGTLLNNRHGIVLFHWQDGGYHRLWQVDRSVKNLRSPSGQAPQYNVLQAEWIDNHKGTPGKAECIVIAIGANRLNESVPRFAATELPGLPLRVLTKRKAELRPDEPDDWIHAAAEIADVISSSAADDVYLFMDGPAVLALMAGDAIGPYRSRIHLMQWVKERQTYVEVLVLQDEQLSAMLD